MTESKPPLNGASSVSSSPASSPRSPAPRHGSEASADRLALGIIAGLAIVFFLPALVQAASAIVGSRFYDGLAYFYPARAFATTELQGGRLPLWNPYIFCGHPFHAEGQGAVFYPLNLLFASLPPALSMNLFAFLHFLGAGVFFYLYLREIQLGVVASLFGALVYQLSSEPVSRLYAGHYTIIPFLALVPAVLWLYERWRRRGGAAWLVWAALAYGCMVLAGYPQGLLYSTLYLGTLVLFTRSERASEGGLRRLAASATALGLVVLAGALLGAVQLFPSYAFAQYSFRQRSTYEFCCGFSFPPENFLTLLAPRFFGDLADPGDASRFPYWGRNRLWDMWAYVGILPLALGLMAAGDAGGRRKAAHAVAVPLFAVLALGGHTPLFHLLYYCVPFFSYFRASSRFIFLALLSLCALAAMGAEHLLSPVDERRARRDRRRLLIILGVMAAIGAGLLAWFGRQPEAEASAWRGFLRWRFEQGESEQTPYSLDRLPPAAESWAAAARSVHRSMALAAAAFLMIAAWGRLNRRGTWAVAALFALAIPELWLFSSSYFVTASVKAIAIPAPFVSAVREDTEPVRIISTGVVPNAFSVCRLETARGYAGNITARFNHFFTAVSGLPRDLSMFLAPLNRTIQPQLLWANVRYAIVHRKAPLPPERGDLLVQSGDEALYRLRRTVRRAYFSPHFTRFSSAEAALEALEQGRTTVFQADLVEAADAQRFSAVGPPVQGDHIEFVERQPGRVVLTTNAAGPRLLVLSDSYDPNWRCRIDRKQAAAIYPVNVAFRGVIVPAGKHEAEFRYAPRSFYWGLATTCLSLLAAVGLLLTGFFRRSRVKAAMDADAAGS